MGFAERDKSCATAAGPRPTTAEEYLAKAQASIGPMSYNAVPESPPGPPMRHQIEHLFDRTTVLDNMVAQLRHDVEEWAKETEARLRHLEKTVG